MKKTVLVTGASGEIGSAIAAQFAGEGARVVLGCNSRLHLAQDLYEALAAEGHEVMLSCADVCDEEQVERMFNEAEEEYGSVDVLVNNAGIAQQKMFCDLTLSEWNRMMAVNVTGTFLCSKRALAGMVRKKNGCIINISSMWGQVGASCEVHYSTAKAAVIGMTKALAKEVALSNIRVNCIAPGAIDGGMMENFDAKAKLQLCEEIPLGRMGLPQEVATAAVFLASENAAWITGQVLGLNGGMVV